MKQLIWLVFLLNNILHSQIDSASNIYFPLGVGNQWQYEVIIDPVWNPDTLVQHHKIIGDTILTDGKKYYTRLILPDSIYRFERIDSSGSKVFLFVLSIADSGHEYCIHDFAKADTLTKDYVGNMNIIANRIRLVTRYVFQTWTYTFSEGLGLSRYVYQFIDGYFEYQTLNWARIDSVEYGNFITKIDQSEINWPKKIKLFQNYPNPFNSSTIITFTLPKQESVIITIYNVIGEKIETLFNKKIPAGNHKVEFDARNISSGIYFYQIQAGKFQDVKKMILFQ